MNRKRNKPQGGDGRVGPANHGDEQDKLPVTENTGETSLDAHDAAALEEWKGLMVQWLNAPPERNRPSVVLPKPPYFDRSIDDIQRFMERAKPKINKDILKQIIRGGSGLFEQTLDRPITVLAKTLLAHDLMRECFVAPGGERIWVPMNGEFASRMGTRTGLHADIEVPIGIDEPHWRPGRDKPGGGGGTDPGEDDADIVYMPISYEEFIELLQLLFDLPFLKQNNQDKLLHYTIKMRGLKRSGPRVRLDLEATAVARIERWHATYNNRPEDFAHIEDPSVVPSVVDFPYNQVDLRYKRVEERWDPDSKAMCMFKLDTSGSMGGEPLAIAKFYFLLNLIWLRTRYKEVTVVYVAYNHRAERIRSEADFFRVGENGGTGMVCGYELGEQIVLAEFPGDDWSKYCFDASDGFGESESYITPWIERFVRVLGFSYMGYCEVNPYGGFGWGGNYETSFMKAHKNVAPDVKSHVGFGRVSTLDEVPAVMMEIMTKGATPEQP
jgi:uncharacterized sporulation protein YeaH/YhbH (DUF444 family)